MIGRVGLDNHPARTLAASRAADRFGPKPVVAACFATGAAALVLLTLGFPLAGLLAERAAQAGGDPHATADSLLGVRAVFGDDLPAAAGFRDEVRAALAALIADGARATVRRCA